LTPEFHVTYVVLNLSLSIPLQEKGRTMTYDLIVVGGSFAGLSAAMQLARARRSVLVIDAGHPRNRFARTSHGFLGQDGKPPREIIDEGKRQLALYPTVDFTSIEAVAACATKGRFSVSNAGGREVSALRLVLATGVHDELPPIPGVQERWGVTILHCPYCHGYEVGNQAVGVLANHPSSPHQGMLLPDWGPTTYFTQGAFEPDGEQAASLAARGVRIERTPIVELLGKAPGLKLSGSAMTGSCLSQPSSRHRRRKWRARWRRSLAVPSMMDRWDLTFA
jgi:thioredoxin reductase